MSETDGIATCFYIQMKRARSVSKPSPPFIRLIHKSEQKVQSFKCNSLPKIPVLKKMILWHRLQVDQGWLFGRHWTSGDSSMTMVDNRLMPSNNGFRTTLFVITTNTVGSIIIIEYLHQSMIQKWWLSWGYQLWQTKSEKYCIVLIFLGFSLTDMSNCVVESCGDDEHWGVRLVQAIGWIKGRWAGHT